ncbi:hypothetical protein OG226_49160 [Streptomyces sp. NBC_01261]|uniref:hypothetical protein n=1 Tax=Streptomyces sp. NBC_01261 TaxID=2903802 RepID=UPI002E3652DF|nr:hypothetical protein [Streptomyces sp. NBC_01261]
MRADQDGRRQAGIDDTVGFAMEAATARGPPLPRPTPPHEYPSRAVLARVRRRSIRL